MLDVLLVGVLALVCTGVGIPVARLLPSPPFRWRLLLAPTLGIAILSVGINVAYRFGASPGASLVVAAATAVLLGALEIRRWIRGAAPEPGDPGTWRSLLAAVGAWTATVALLLAPRWVGGDQFAVFQGNQWDTFGYLESALVYAREPYEFVAKAHAPEFLRNPLVITASGNLHCRPAVHLLYAAFSRVAPGEAHRLHYAFLVFLISQSFLVSAFLLRTWLPRARVSAIVAAASAFVLGFWGQYVFDINAWSQIASVGVLLLAFGLIVEVAAAPLPDLPPTAPRRLAAVLAVAVAGAFFLYPESLVYHLSVLVPLAVGSVALRTWRTGRPSPAPFVPLLGVGGVAAGALYWKGTLGFVLDQLTAAQGPPVEWWRFFQAFFAGRDFAQRGHGALAAAIDFGAGFFGLYFATPTAPSGLDALYRRIAIVVTVGALLLALGAVLAGRASPPEAERGISPHKRSRLRFAALALGLLLVPAAYMALRGNYWPAGKGVSFVSPMLMMLLAVPLAIGMPAPWAALRWVTGAFVAFQIATGFARVAGARDPSGIHFSRPYPSVQEPELKQVLRWDVEPLGRQLRGSERVLIAPMNVWTTRRLMTFLYTRGDDFFALGPIVANFGAGEELGSMPPPWQGDALIELTRSGLAVRFANGRPPTLVAWPGQVR